MLPAGSLLTGDAAAPDPSLAALAVAVDGTKERRADLKAHRAAVATAGKRQGRIVWHCARLLLDSQPGKLVLNVAR